MRGQLARVLIFDQVVGEYPVSAPDRGAVAAVQEGPVPSRSRV